MYAKRWGLLTPVVCTWIKERGQAVIDMLFMCLRKEQVWRIDDFSMWTRIGDAFWMLFLLNLSSCLSCASEHWLSSFFALGTRVSSWLWVMRSRMMAASGPVPFLSFKNNSHCWFPEQHWPLLHRQFLKGLSLYQRLKIWGQIHRLYKVTINQLVLSGTHPLCGHHQAQGSLWFFWGWPHTYWMFHLGCLWYFLAFSTLCYLLSTLPPSVGPWVSYGHPNFYCFYQCASPGPCPFSSLPVPFKIYRPWMFPLKGIPRWVDLLSFPGPFSTAQFFASKESVTKGYTPVLGLIGWAICWKDMRSLACGMERR